MNIALSKDSGMCPYIDDIHEECNISELNSMTIELMTKYCGRGNYRGCHIYKNLASEGEKKVSKK